MIFRFVAIGLQRDTVLAHPLAQSQRGIAKQHRLFIQPDRAPWRRRQGPWPDKQALPLPATFLQPMRQTLTPAGLRPGRATAAASSRLEGGDQRRNFRAIRRIREQRAQWCGRLTRRRRDLGSASSLIPFCGARLRAVSLTGNRHTDGHMQTIKQAAANTFGDQDQQQADQQPRSARRLAADQRT